MVFFQNCTRFSPDSLQFTFSKAAPLLRAEFSDGKYTTRFENQVSRRRTEVHKIFSPKIKMEGREIIVPFKCHGFRIMFYFLYGSRPEAIQRKRRFKAFCSPDSSRQTLCCCSIWILLMLVPLFYC